jgi:nucleotide-binding universal stress UspA family protein
VPAGGDARKRRGPADRHVLTGGATISQTILALLDRRETAHPVLVAAALVADRLGDARIEVLHVRHDALEGFMPTEEIMTSKRRQELDLEATQLSTDLHAVFDAWRRTRKNGVWREMTGQTAPFIAVQAEEVDLIVIGHGQHRLPPDANQALHVALFKARLSTLLVPPAEPAALGACIAVAWKQSDAAIRAIEAALPLLLRAEQVCVLMETDHAGDSAPLELIDRLAQAGVPVHVRRFEAGERSTGEALIAEAHEAGADLLVMGAYTHNRLTEFILGGATREVIAAADLPVLLHH